MTDLVSNKNRLKTIVYLFIFMLIGSGAVFAKVGEFEVPLEFKSRFAPPLELSQFPGGLSVHKSDIYHLKLKTIEREWYIEIPYKSDYALLTLYAGNYKLYNQLSIKRDVYVQYISRKAETAAWIEDMANFSGTKGKGGESEGIVIRPPIEFPKPVESIIGEGGPRINVSGSRRISFSGRSQWDDLPQTGTFKQSKFPSLHMEQTSRFKIKGQIGSKVTIEVDQDSNRDVDIANTLKLRYRGGEDEIIQSIEAGNTNLALPNSQFIGFSQNVQGLFGIKATAKIGNMDLTVITSQEKGSNEKSTFTAGAQASADTIWDWQYLHNVYFYLGPFGPNDNLIDLKLYTNDTQNNRYGLACVDPRGANNENGGIDTVFYVSPEEEERNEVERRYFRLIEQNIDYVFFSSGWYIILNQPLGENDVLAAYIKYRHTEGGIIDTLQEGSIAGDTLVLKLIRDPNTDPSFTTWDLEWKRVYDLRARDITPDGFELDIYKGLGNLLTDTLDQNGTRYIELFGFDRYNNNNPADETPDGLFDFNTTVPHIDPARGHLIFEQPEPFIAGFLNDPNPPIYEYKYGNNNRSESRRYYIYVKTAKRASTFSLGRTNIIEGSEVVKLGDGTVLRRGIDYNIIYEIGQITFLNEDALSAAADISVDFEYSPFFMPEKKSLFGLAAEYKINDNSAFTISGMYRKESTKDFRPRVGREPKRWLIWDSNLILRFEPEFLTQAVDALPFVETESPSLIEFAGEVAQNIPNPNIRNDAFIDDFEGSRESTDLVMRRGVWTIASPPTGYDVLNRREAWWYNPYDPIPITAIWPEKDVQSHENRQDVIILEYFPDSTGGSDFEGWAGIMRPMYSGLADQSRTKFIEIWYLPDSSASQHPILYFDAGDISEDLDSDNFKDTEDRNGNGVFEDNEDTGLDTLTSSQERNQPGAPNVDDPSGDDWNYSENNPYDYSRINGTEGNRQDPDRLNRYDTEDINNNGTLDFSNSYFQFEIDLNDDRYVQEITSTGYRLLRIPFQDSSAFGIVGNPDQESINFLRVWMTGVSSHYKLQLASLEFVGNKWQELAPPDPIYMNGIPITPGFEVTVKNTQEHANSYSSPPGIVGEYDRETGVQEKEQSLVLRYDNLFPGQRLGTYWTLMQTEDYTQYNKLKMFVHGDERLSDELPLNFFFRVGTDSTRNYYEFRTKLYPGWDERNYVEINFEEITALKSYLHNSHPDSITLVDTTYAHYKVKGNPSLSTVKMFVMGVTYDSLLIDTTYFAGDSVVIDTSRVPLIPINGEVWCDELFLTDVRKESDFAGRFSAKLGLADLGNVQVNFSRMGADFYKLNEKKPSGSMSTQQSVSGRFNVDKLFPPSWGMSLPVNLSWQKSLQVPRLKVGSDIIVPEALKDLEKTENKSWSVTISESFRKNTKNWLFNWTLNRIQTRYVYNKRTGTSPTQPVSNSYTYEASGKYDLTPRSKPSFKPLLWMKYIFLPKGIYDIQLFFLPTALKYDALVKGTNSYSIDNRGNPRSTYAKDFQATQTYGMGLFSALKADFSSTTNRDISDPEKVKLSYNPADIKLGREKTYAQSFSLSFTPKFSRLLSPRVTFNSRYSDNSDLARNPDSTRSSSINATLRGDLTLDVFQIIGLNKLLGSEDQKNKFVPNKPQREEKKDEEKEPEEKGEGEIDVEGETGEGEKTSKRSKIPNPLKVVKRTFRILNTIKPVKTTVSSDKKLDRAGLYERPGWMYTLGFNDDPKVARKTETNYTRDQITRTLDYSFQSGIAPFRNLDVNASYKYRNSVSRSSNSNVATETNSLEFPRLDANLSGLEKLPFFQVIAQTVTLQSNYSLKNDETGDPDRGELNNRTVNNSYAPLMGLNLVLKKGIKVTIRYDQNNKKTEDLRTEGGSGRTEYDTDKGIKFSVSYSLTAPQGISLPIFGKVKFSSQLTMSLDIDKRFRKSWFFLGGDKTIDANSDEITVEPRMTYRFSAKVTGGLNAKWSDANDKIQQRKRHIRELGIWTELRF